MFFYGLTLFVFFRWIKSPDWRLALAFGLSLGLGFSSKYMMVLFALSLTPVLFTSVALRRALFKNLHWVVLGGLLMGGMAVLSWIMYGVIQGSSDPRASTRFTGSESDMMFMFGIFALVFFFGLTSFVAGLWQVIFGKRNLILVWIMLGLGGIFMLAGAVVRYLD